MSYSAKVIAHSVGPHQIPIATIQATIPRFVLAQWNMHGLLSKNAASSRAIPIDRMLDWVRHDPVMPLHYGSRKKGMQAGAEIKYKGLAKLIIKGMMYTNIAGVWALDKLGLHKQNTNRYLEPWAYVNVLATATNWENFLALRAHKDAQPEIQKVAVLIGRALRNSKPRELRGGEWHLPYIDYADTLIYSTDDLIKMSVARCARVSYLTFDGKAPNYKQDISLYNKLVLADPPHMSPTQHQATALLRHNDAKPSNFKGWNRYREELPNNFRDSFDYDSLDLFGEACYLV